MTNRIGTYGASQQYLQQILNLQDRTNKEELQVSSGKVSQTYSGIAQSADTVLNFQVSESLTAQYQTDNSVTNTKLQASGAAVTGIQTTITNFKNQLVSFQQNSTTDQQQVTQLQTFAFQAMQDMQAYLGANINGDYLFSGGKTSTAPVQLPASTMDGFQAIYDGSNLSYPTTGSADLLNVNMGAKQTTALSFVPSSGVIVGAQANALAPVTTGSNITIAGTTSNNGTYNVKSQAATNYSGQALGETSTTSVPPGAGTGATVTYGSAPDLLQPVTTGGLNYAFAANGQMTVTPTNPNTLSALTPGTRFTVTNTTGGAWDGSYVVTGNTGGTVTFANNEAPTNEETVSSSDLTLQDATTALGTNVPLTSGNLRFASTASATTGLTTVTLTAAGPNDFTGINVGDYITMGGTTDHNGSYQVSAVTGNTISFTMNPEAVRVSQFVPQINRTDVTVTGNDSQGNAAAFTSKTYGSLTFSPTGNGGETLTAANAGAFTSSAGEVVPQAGSLLKLASTSGVNDGTYTVVSNDGTNIVVKGNPLTSETNSTTATLSSTSYYQGDTLVQQQIIDQNRSVNIGTTAADPAFEKAIRAMGIIAQGVYGTAGGLDQNMGRISNALYLLNDSLQSPAAGTPPYGPEKTSDLNSVSQNIGYTQQIITTRNTTMDQIKGYLQTQIASQINSDPTTAVTTLLNDSNSLQAAYQALSQIRNLNLMNYLK